jgi:hypothetical protein
MSGGLFLFIQAVFLQILWRPDPEISTAGPVAIIFTILTLLALLAAIGFFLLNRIGWLVAMMVQGACLFVALVLYFENASSYTQLTMFFSIFMVLYLNSFIVRSAFGAKIKDEQDDTGENE